MAHFADAGMSRQATEHDHGRAPNVDDRALPPLTVPTDLGNTVSIPAPISIGAALAWLCSMRYAALACDYDGTIASHGLVEASTIEALERLRTSGRRLVLVTGRDLDDLMRVCPHVHLFDRIVVENGAVVCNSQTRDVRMLADAPPEEFARELQRRGVALLSVGHVIVAT